MNIKILTQAEDKITYLISETEVSLVNSLRRLIMEEVPVMAIEEVTFNKNNSALYDEMIANRLGLIPLTTDLQGYNFKEDCKCKGKGCSSCQVKITLDVKGPCTVFAKDLKSKDSKIKPAYQDMPIVLLLKGQNLELEAIANLGRGKDHSKFSPGLAYYRQLPTLKASKESNSKKAIQESSNIIAKGSGLEIKDIASWTEADEQICERNNVEIELSNSEFIFTLESWGQLEAKKIPSIALKIMEEKLKQLDKQIK